MHLTPDHPRDGLFRHTALGPSPLPDSVRLDGTQELASPASSQALPVQGPRVASSHSSGRGRDGSWNIGRKEQKARAEGRSSRVELEVSEDRTGGAWPGEQRSSAVRRGPSGAGDNLRATRVSWTLSRMIFFNVKIVTRALPQNILLPDSWTYVKGPARFR